MGVAAASGFFAADTRFLSRSVLTIDGVRARVGCHPRLTLHADGPLRVKIAGCVTG